MTVPRNRESDARSPGDEILERITRRLGAIDREIVGVAPLVEERSRLLRARSLLIGRPDAARESAAGRSARVTGHDIFDFLTRNPGAHPGDIARALGCGQPAVSAHLYRGKGKSFSTQYGRWYPIPA